MAAIPLPVATLRPSVRMLFFGDSIKVNVVATASATKVTEIESGFLLAAGPWDTSVRARPDDRSRWVDGGRLALVTGQGMPMRRGRGIVNNRDRLAAPHVYKFVLLCILSLSACCTIEKAARGIRR